MMNRRLICFFGFIFLLVSACLIANKTLPENLIQATYGPNRPLAPNTTAENRAINRRIDIVITPDMVRGETP